MIRYLIVQAVIAHTVKTVTQNLARSGDPVDDRPRNVQTVVLL